MALDAVPWPWSERIVVGLGVVSNLARPNRRRRFVAWARAQGAAHPWRLAIAIGAFRGRWLARTRFLGMRDPATLKAQLVLEGAEHVAAIRGGTIFLGFHVGPLVGEVVLNLFGYGVTYLGIGDGARIVWLNEAWRRYTARDPLSRAGGGWGRWPARLYDARRTLKAGGKIYTMADGGGREAFRLRLPGGDWSIRAGWLTLHQLTGAAVVPVLGHFDGRRQVVVFHPPLPPVAPDSPAGLDVARERLTRLLEDYVRRFPEHCPNLALGELA